MIRALTVVLACPKGNGGEKITEAGQIRGISLQQNSLCSLGVITLSLVAMTATAEWRLSDQWGWKRRRMKGTLHASPRKAPMLALDLPRPYQTDKWSKCCQTFLVCEADISASGIHHLQKVAAREAQGPQLVSCLALCQEAWRAHQQWEAPAVKHSVSGPCWIQKLSLIRTNVKAN